MEQTKRKYRGIEDVYEAEAEIKRSADHPPQPSGGQNASGTLAVLPAAPDSYTSTSAQAHPRPTPGPVTPSRDFYKRPNSLERVAVSAGIFPGGTKNTYDVLYQRTRGAVVPVRSIQATKRQLMSWADVCNEKTIEAHLKHLCGVGLLKRTGSLGDNKGQYYEVFTPEELGLEEEDSTPPQPRPTPGPPPAQKLAPPQAQKLPPGGLGNPLENTGTYADDKTFLKTDEEIDDDEGFAPLARAAEEVMGKPALRESWRELAELLAVELKIAAGRTTVSSAPAFLTEHLRRRLWKKDKRQMTEEGKAELRPSLAGLDASKCPDCRGTGMWYPEGYEKGVARCRHEKLTAEEEK
jgi:hypothetical protein